MLCPYCAVCFAKITVLWCLFDIYQLISMACPVTLLEINRLNYGMVIIGCGRSIGNRMAFGI